MRPYLELLRPANIATALADIIAGFAIAGATGSTAALAWLLASTAGLYGGGVVLNDFFDRRIDASERPERPIPSARVPAAHAALLGASLLAIGVLAASRVNATAALVAALLVVLILSYDAGLKHVPAIGPLNMGACRAVNLILGMTAVAGAVAAHWPVALISLTYIVAITTLSRGEVHGGTRAVAVGSFLAIAFVIVALSGMALQAGSRLVVSLLLVAFLAWRVLPPFWRAVGGGPPATIRAAIKAGVLSLVVLDAALAAVYAGPVYAVAALGMGVVAFALARLFAVT